MEFLGHKADWVGRIVEVIADYAGRGATVGDLFCGTALVSAQLRAEGYRVLANDTLLLCATWARARLLAESSPRFRGLRALGAEPYDEVIGQLNAASPRRGYCWRTYSPASRGRTCRHARMYFTEANAARIDGIRAQIEIWRPALTTAEHALLISCLVDATVRISNVAGTYGCYLKEWKSRALQPLHLRALRPGAGSNQNHSVILGDASVAASRELAVVYLDPPYTKRQYAAYYHVIETIARGDAPNVQGRTGLRDWRPQSSRWCYRRRAPAALWSLLQANKSPLVLLNYNDDGQIPHTVLMEVLRRHGKVTVEQRTVRRYRANRLRGNDHVDERLYIVRR
jgi:adenine-specific DNA-methyltransferase